MTNKMHWMKWYQDDFERDTALLSLAAVGAWIRIIHYLRPRDGIATLPFSDWANLLRLSIDETIILISEIKSFGVCNANHETQMKRKCNAENVSCNDLVTIECRRLVREAKERNGSTSRVQRHREKKRNAHCNANVTPKKLRNQESKNIDSAISESGTFNIDKSSTEGSEAVKRLGPQRVFSDWLLKEWKLARRKDLRTGNGDWAQVSKLLKWSEGRAGYSVEELKASWLRFLNSPEEFHQKQGHPVAYWATNIATFIRDRAPAQRTSIGENTITMEDYEGI